MRSFTYYRYVVSRKISPRFSKYQLPVVSYVMKEPLQLEGTSNFAAEDNLNKANVSWDPEPMIANTSTSS